LCLICGEDCFGELVAAGGRPHAAANAGQRIYYLIHGAPGDQTGNCLQVAVAAAGKFYFFYNISVRFYLDAGGAGRTAFRLIENFTYKNTPFADTVFIKNMFAKGVYYV